MANPTRSIRLLPIASHIFLVGRAQRVLEGFKREIETTRVTAFLSIATLYHISLSRGYWR